jgi:hypothetical protein
MTAEAFHNSSHPDLHRLDIMGRLSNTPTVLATYKQYKHDTEYLPFLAVEHMFRQKQLPVWVTFAVELLFASQDLLGDEVAMPMSIWLCTFRSLLGKTTEW